MRFSPLPFRKKRKPRLTIPTTTVTDSKTKNWNELQRLWRWRSRLLGLLALVTAEIATLESALRPPMPNASESGYQQSPFSLEVDSDYLREQDVV